MKASINKRYQRIRWICVLFKQFFVRKVITFLRPKLLAVLPLIDLTCTKPLVTQAKTKVM